MKRSPSRKPVCGFHALETRQMMAGDVTVTTMNEGNSFDLHIDGDLEGNQIEVSQQWNRIVVRGINGTTVNGRSAAAISVFQQLGRNSRMLDDIKIDMGRGDDLVEISGLNNNFRNDANLEIELGHGSDQVRLYNVRTNNDLTIDGGSSDHADRVLLWNVSADDIEIDTGRGDDSVAGYMVGANDAVEIDTDDGEDTVQFFRLSSQELDIDLGDHDDLLILRATNASDVDLDGGNGFDQLRYSPVSAIDQFMMEFDPVEESDNFEVFGQLAN